MQDATMEKLKSDALQQVWSPSDLDPDVLEAEISRMFSYNQSETERHNDSKMYFNGNVEAMKQSAAKGSGSLSGSIGKGFLKVFSLGLSGSGETATTTSSKNHTITDQVMSETDIQKHLSQHAMETEWRGKKLRPQEFKVYKLSDITDHLQIAVISKQLSVDKEQNAIVRIISTMNTPHSIPTNHTPSHLVITGEVRLYSGASKPPYPWLLCDGSTVSRAEYQRLFAVIGTQYGSGDYSLGKAHERAVHSLPKDTNKRIMVVQHLAQNLNIISKTTHQHTRQQHSLSIELKELVIQFYQRDDITYQLPGKRDYVTVTDDNGESMTLQKRILLYNIRETYQLFVNEYSNKNVDLSLTSFNELRPVNKNVDLFPRLKGQGLET
ncbi:unnamed protein product [Rotaria sp. Silwood1]|nr:unnamed protein product [Rotaria sp. Silwood1]